jgi:hypothetical protein
MNDQLDVIRISARKVENYCRDNLVGREVVDIFINDRDIRDIIHEVELPFAIQNGTPDSAGSYEGLAPYDVFFPNMHFMGNPDDKTLLKNGRVPILRCGCGVIDCDPIYTKITALEERVIWSDFVNPWHTLEWTKEPWDYSSLHFVFDREQYESQFSKNKD